ncbi:hypothetical protein BCR33DRAFT_714759 [Rhizoclosmatium globosum]|uniref:Cytochrome b561 domain-containing protein n=1 Tax=Rhizoclosmatium globosum TaxID=329046 RepID=A0A1Y2CLC9_9FUNG|nr:hypothetical protein BCR33DRAFT_714759 [Rhizoclosmatium globosum]|eukprot:ORY47664.1 hypothetical protein BCR33DRAFT_714759 [Rhizoclosmatium globosum]
MSFLLCPKTILIVSLGVAMAATAYPYTKEYVLYSLHPIAMCLFIWASISASIMLQRTDSQAKTAAERKRNVSNHAVLQIIACIAACVGFWAVNQNKTNKGKRHWESWHGVIGLLTFALTVAVSILGTAMRYFPVTTFGGIGASKKWTCFKRYTGLVLMGLTVYVTGTGLLEHSTIQRIPGWERYTIFVVVVLSSGFCFWNCAFEYVGKEFRRFVRSGPEYEQLA